MLNHPELFNQWVEKVREQLHEQDKRIVRLETTNKVLSGVLGILLILISMTITIILSRNHEEKATASIEYVKPKEPENDK